MQLTAVSGSHGNPAMPRVFQMERPWSAARDRLSSTLFLAGLLHGILILGITFQAAAPPPGPTATSLDVVIVTRDYAHRAAPQNAAALLAEQNLTGRGNAAADARLRTAVAVEQQLAAPGLYQDGSAADPRRSGEALPAEALLAATARDTATLRQGKSGSRQSMHQRPFQATDSDATDILAQPDELTRIPDANPRELLVSASTREDRIASYLNSWKNKVERVGTLNFPAVSEPGAMRRHPVLEVAVKANGELKEIIIRSSSGQPRLDHAAMDILRMAAPFDPFPKMLRDDYDVLRFAYEWHFGTDQTTGRIRTVSGG